MTFSVTKNGKPLDKSKYTWDAKTKTFASTEDGLVLDFNNMNFCTFKTGFSCTFKTGSDCTFDTGHNCTFDTGGNCTFKTGSECVVVRRDVFEVHQLYPDIQYVLNNFQSPGFKNEKEIKEQIMEVAL